MKSIENKERSERKRGQRAIRAKTREMVREVAREKDRREHIKSTQILRRTKTSNI